MDYKIQNDKVSLDKIIDITEQRVSKITRSIDLIGPLVMIFGLDLDTFGKIESYLPKNTYAEVKTWFSEQLPLFANIDKLFSKKIRFCATDI